ncbi:PHOsphatase [Thoreauomyces humboldtii]|nr:PHOsphatase [Thoreauomyces humboldtii]
MKNLVLIAFALTAVTAGPLEQYATPIVDRHLPLIGSPARGQDLALGTKSRYNIPANSTKVPTLSARSKCSVPRTSVPVATESRSQCKVIQVQLIARHGTRNPTAGNLKKQKALQADLRAAPLKQKYAFLANGTAICSDDMAGMLTTQGFFDHVLLAQRLKARYPTVLSDASKFSWQATNVSRAIASGESFQQGLLSNRTDRAAASSQIRQSVLPEHQDADLRPFDSCNAFANGTAVLKAQPQADDAFKSVTFPAIRERLAEEIGFANLTQSHVEQMFSICSFENTLQGKNSGFCSLFDSTELVLDDFATDLNFWTYRGYGFPINEQLACSLLTTVSDNMAKVVNGSSDAFAGVFKFAHAETIAPIISTLGLFKDPSPGLFPNMTDAQQAARLYKARDFVPFAGNVLFELRDCGTGDAQADRYTVRILSDERAVTLPGCTEHCPLTKFQSLLKGKIGCDFDGAVCGNKKPTVGGSATFGRKSQLSEKDATPSDAAADD